MARPVDGNGGTARTRLRRRRTAVLVVVAAATVVGSAIAATRSSSRAQPAATAAFPANSSRPVPASVGGAVGQPLPRLSVPQAAGEDLIFPRAGRATAVFFFAAWCGSCIDEAKALDELHREHNDDLDVVIVDIDPADRPADIEAFLEAAGSPSYPVVTDTDGTLTRAFGVTALDTTVISDARGTVVYRDAVPTTLTRLRAAAAQAGVQ